MVHRDAALQQHTGSLQLSPELSSMSLTLWGTTILFHGAAQVTDTLQTDTSQPKIVSVCVCMGECLIIAGLQYDLSNITDTKVSAGFCIHFHKKMETGLPLLHTKK